MSNALEIQPTIRFATKNRVSHWFAICVLSFFFGCLSGPTAFGKQTTESAEARTSPEPLRSLASYFPFQPPASLEQWKVRRQQVQNHLKVVLGLYPPPSKTPLNAVIHGRIEMEGYSIEKVYFESMPGFLVTGNLYRPIGAEGEGGDEKFPGVLCPHGHHREGRFRKATPREIGQQIGNQSEKFFSNAQSPQQARCVHLAKLGCIVFHYDMIGYADCEQISYQLAHRFIQQRPGFNEVDGWGFFSPRAESYLQSIMGLQTWNSIRCLDFLESLPEVDAKRIGVTGASGGGTQTMIVCAIDDRPAVAFPAVMVSTAMQGGCTCENCSYLRIGTGNVEFAALFAPKPLGLTAANDWTREMETKGFPELKELYSLYRQSDNVQLTSRTEFSHNYNQVSREAMYRWFAKHLGLEGNTTESPIEFKNTLELTVFDHPKHKKPIGGDDYEKGLLKAWRDDMMKNVMKRVPKDQATLKKWREFMKPVLRTMVGDADSTSDSFSETVSWEEREVNASTLEIKITLKNKRNEQIRGVAWLQDDARELVLLASEDGSACFAKNHPNRALVDALLENEFNVLAIDHLFISEQARTRTRVVNNHRETAAFTQGYNAPQIVKRVHSYVYQVDRDSLEDESEIFTEPEMESEPGYFVVALDKSSADIALGVAHLSLFGEPSSIKGVLLNTNGFRFENVTSIRDPYFLPGAGKYLDLPGLLSLAAPTPLAVFGESEESLKITLDAYRAAQASENIRVTEQAKSTKIDIKSVISWLNKHATNR